MNCECIYYKKGATTDELLELAKFVQRGSNVMERYPCAISVITEDTDCCDDYDCWGKKKTIPAGSVVLFVAGKLHYQVPIHMGKRNIFRPWYPVSHDIKFYDLKTDFEGSETNG